MSVNTNIEIVFVCTPNVKYLCITSLDYLKFYFHLDFVGCAAIQLLHFYFSKEMNKKVHFIAFKQKLKYSTADN